MAQQVEFPGALIVVPAIWTTVTTFQRIQAGQRLAAQTPINGWIGLLLYLVFTPALYAYMQSGLNSAWRAEAQPRNRAMDGLLLAWFADHGADLPWRRTRDPYAILVSEVMLQQTQVERVIPRYERWLERWPTANALAAASPAEVIRQWQGLGYNRRALNLHRAVGLVARHGWPEDLTELPGVGPYTAHAVRAFAFGEAVLPRDTNVLRVEERTGHRFGSESGQALMDLGRTICLARVPRCGSCPLAKDCPSRGRRYEPVRKQSRFEGSFRQRRAAALRLVASAPTREQGLDAEVIASLERDGLVERADGVVALPS